MTFYLFNLLTMSEKNYEVKIYGIIFILVRNIFLNIQQNKMMQQIKNLNLVTIVYYLL